MSYCKRIAILLVTVLFIGIFSEKGVEAKTPEPGRSKIKVAATKDGSGIKVTIKKTSNADGYKIYVAFDEARSLYLDDEKNHYSASRWSYGYEEIATVKKSGTKKRSITLKAKDLIKYVAVDSLCPGTYKIKVFAYKKGKKNDTESEFSAPKKVTVKMEEGKGYKDEYDISSLNVGDTIEFGSYEQDGSIVNGSEPLSWVVYEKTDDKVYLLAKDAIDCLPINYDEECEGDLPTWEVCSLRRWLNENFYNAAFNDYEKALIANTKLENSDNVKYGTEAGNDTEDKIFLLSDKEALKLKKENAQLISGSYTKYCQERGVEIEGEKCRWWLRTPGHMDEDDYEDEMYSFTFMETNDTVHEYGLLWFCDFEVDDCEDYALDIMNGLGVRPVITLDLAAGNN